MLTPIESAAVLEILKAAQLLAPDFYSNLKARHFSYEPLGTAPIVVGQLRAYKEAVRKMNAVPGLSERQQNLNLARLHLIGNMIILELEHAFPIKEGRHVLWAGGEVGQQL